jgi:hypothetical protein
VLCVSSRVVVPRQMLSCSVVWILLRGISYETLKHVFYFCQLNFLVLHLPYSFKDAWLSRRQYTSVIRFFLGTTSVIR